MKIRAYIDTIDNWRKVRENFRQIKTSLEKLGIIIHVNKISVVTPNDYLSYIKHL